MEHDVYYERQRALIERSLQSEREREELREAIRKYKREMSGRKAYFKLQNTKRGRITRDAGTTVCWKSQRTTHSKGERKQVRTRRFPNSYTTVCYEARPY